MSDAETCDIEILSGFSGNSISRVTTFHALCWHFRNRLSQWIHSTYRTANLVRRNSSKRSLMEVTANSLRRCGSTKSNLKCPRMGFSSINLISHTSQKYIKMLICSYASTYRYQNRKTFGQIPQAQIELLNR